MRQAHTGATVPLSRPPYPVSDRPGEGQCEMQIFTASQGRCAELPIIESRPVILHPFPKLPRHSPLCVCVNYCNNHPPPRGFYSDIAKYCICNYSSLLGKDRPRTIYTGGDRTSTCNITDGTDPVIILLLSRRTDLVHICSTYRTEPMHTTLLTG